MNDVLVLCYHATSRSWSSELSVRPDILEQQVRYLLRKRYRGATFSDAVSARSGKTFAITFDDAYSSVFDNARPLLQALGVPATVFVPTSFPDSGKPLSWDGIEEWLDTPDRAELTCMSWEELRHLEASGWEVGSHTHSHPHLTELDDAALAEELTRSRILCEEQLGRCSSIAYPYGDVDRRVAEAAATAGYLHGATLPAGFHRPAQLLWPRLGVYGDSMARFRLKTMRPVRALRVRPS